MTRQEQILKLIVEFFIKTGEPVGSKTLLEEYHLPYSSATIRAEMNSLEKGGYLEKTHASSGRVPSAKGYTYYVERLREESVDDSVKYALQKVLDEKSKSVEEVMKESCQILSNMTNLASVVLGSKAEEEKLASVQLIPLSGNSAAAVFVTDKGYVENKTFVVSESVSLEEVQKTVALLNQRLVGTPISGVVEKLEAMRPALTDYVVEHDFLYQAILRAFISFSASRINSYGKDKLFQTPEFAEDAKKLQRILKLVDDPVLLRRALEQSTETGEEGVNLAIGSEESGYSDVAILSAEITLPGENKTSISLLGPTRMDYEKAMGVLDYVARTLDEYFNGAKPQEGDKKCQKKEKTKPQSKASPKKKS
ncbi:MAG: heat-inducible transcriptional repressor HrcA [Bacillota bacterium]|nr:heat-inducible transcriptional repressor HrcA [Bacillota bacterium]